MVRRSLYWLHIPWRGEMTDGGRDMGKIVTHIDIGYKNPRTHTFTLQDIISYIPSSLLVCLHFHLTRNL